MEVPQKIRKALDRLAHSLYRRHDPAKVPHILRGLVLNSLAAAAVISAIILCWGKFQDRQHRALIGFEPSRWSVTFGNSDESCWGDRRAFECPASPENQTLWASPLHRWDAAYFDKLENDLKAPYWIGLRISPAEMKKAKESGATRLMLGLFFSRYDVWIDGQRVQTGDYMENDLPIAIDLSTQRMMEDKPLHVAIAVFRDGQMRTIDSSWFVPTMGLFTSRASDQQMRWVVFAGDTRFLMSFSVFFILGLVFRLAANTARQKDEFRAASVHAFALACVQFVMADSTFRLLGATNYYPILNGILAAEVFAAIGFGISMARGRAELMSWVSAGLPITVVSIFILSCGIVDDKAITRVILAFFTPLGYAVAGALCLVQFSRLQREVESGHVSLGRSKMLAVMALVFGTIALSFIVESQQAIAVETHWTRILVIVPLSVLTTKLAADVRRQLRLIETTPISAYHKLARPPESISGIIVNLDLKGSEALFRTGSQQDVGGTIVSTVVSQVWAKFIASGATVMQSSGDDLLVLYEDSKLREDPLLWLKTLRDVHEELQIIARQLADTQVELASLKGLEYRAAVSRGAVRPMWRQVGTTRIPSWVEAGSTNVFVETARLLELEKQWTRPVELLPIGDAVSSILIVDTNIEAALKGIEGLNPVPVSGLGKHGRQYSGFAVVITPQTRTDLRVVNKAV